MVSSDVGEGIFFAGQNHVALRVIASKEEHEVITTNPEEILKRKDEKEIKKALNIGSSPRGESFESYQRTRELKKRRLESSAEFKQNQSTAANNTKQVPLQAQEVKIEKDLLENSTQKAEKALKTDSTRFAIKTVFGEPEEDRLKPDQHGIYNIDDYQPPK